MNSKRGERKEQEAKPATTDAPQVKRDTTPKARAKPLAEALKIIRHKPSRKEQREAQAKEEERENARQEWRKQNAKRLKELRKDEPQPQLARDQPLSKSQLRKIQELVFGDLAKAADTEPAWYWINAAPHPFTYGRLSSFPEAQFLAWISSVRVGMINEGMNADNAAEPPLAFVRHVFDWLAEKVMRNDAEFFERVAILLRAREAGRPIAEISPNELGYKQPPGRKATPHDLKYCVSAAVSEVLQYRVWMLPGDGKGLRHFRITRAELQHAIRKARARAGMKSKPEDISEFELSRWIAKKGISPFMAKQHLR